ncbi:hypothetical protein TcG_07245 [Trypanosoma cruzi]|nr:surface protease GP63 [Trypanosoma cruzi cruzi]RNF15231.1 hypothetical protein TcG_07245 [Trypanosoma cruzi]
MCGSLSVSLSPLRSCRTRGSTAGPNGRRDQTLWAGIWCVLAMILWPRRGTVLRRMASSLRLSNCILSVRSFSAYLHGGWLTASWTGAIASIFAVSVSRHLIGVSAVDMMLHVGYRFGFQGKGYPVCCWRERSYRCKCARLTLMFRSLVFA